MARPAHRGPNPALLYPRAPGPTPPRRYRARPDGRRAGSTRPSPHRGGGGRVMAAGPSFRERYWRAVRDPQLRRNLLAFQRGWRQSRDDRFDEYGAAAGPSAHGTFQRLREPLATP